MACTAVQNTDGVIGKIIIINKLALHVIKERFIKKKKKQLLFRLIDKENKKK